MPPPLPPKHKVENTFDLLVTPNPAELSFRVRVLAVDFKPSQMVQPGTRYDACKFLNVRPRVEFEDFASYVYTYATREEQYLWFNFGKGKTQAERDTPFRTYYTERDYPWPAVLEDVYLVESTFPQSSFNGTTTVTAPLYFPRYRYRPAISVSSLCRVDQYLAEVPWHSSKIRHEQPVPTDVNALYLGVKIDFPRCLHDTVDFPETVPGAKIVQGAGMRNPPLGRNPNKQVFPATNFTDWRDFVVEDKVQPTAGLWLREKVTIFPPSPPEAVIT